MSSMLGRTREPETRTLKKARNPPPVQGSGFKLPRPTQHAAPASCFELSYNITLSIMILTSNLTNLITVIIIIVIIIVITSMIMLAADRTCGGRFFGGGGLLITVIVAKVIRVEIMVIVLIVVKEIIVEIW